MCLGFNIVRQDVGNHPATFAASTVYVRHLARWNLNGFDLRMILLVALEGKSCAVVCD